MTKIKWFALVSSIVLAACGGGGSSSGGNTEVVARWELRGTKNPICHNADDVKVIKGEGSNIKHQTCIWNCATYEGKARRHIEASFFANNFVLVGDMQLQEDPNWKFSHVYENPGKCG